MTGIDVLRGVLGAVNAANPRSKQIESGASQAFGCRAESLLRLTGVTPTDPRVSLPSLWGTAMHHLIEQRIAGMDGLLVEQQHRYRGAPATIDLGIVAEGRLVDWKGSTLAKIAGYRKDGPRPNNRSQVHLGAAALIEAGYEITDVSLVFVPRDGQSIEDCWEWSEPFSRERADEAVDWLAAEQLRAESVLLERPDTPVVTLLDGLRDEPPGFCASYCEFFTACRGEGQPDTASEPAVLDAAQRYATAKIEADEAEQRRKYYAELLNGAPPVVTDGWRVAWTRDTREATEEPDVTQIDVASYEAIVGALPRREVVKGRAPSLRVTKVRAK